MTLLSIYGTEQVGISVEIAIADLTGVEIDPAYRSRGRQELVDHIKPALLITLERIPKPKEHIAEDQNPIDFLLEGDKSLSVKSNMRRESKVAPQIIGQPTSTTFWSHLPQLIPPGIDPSILTYEESSQLFKEVAQSNITHLLSEYWKNFFKCDFMIYVHNVLSRSNELTEQPIVKLFETPQAPRWHGEKLSFTRTSKDWNESSTLKYEEFSIGEFQVHKHRNCFKFRFNLDGLTRAGLLKDI